MSPDCRAGYRGRFAPSPTGPLHLGSLVAAVASYLDARAHGGRWIVRMEDVDEPRSVPGAAAGILRTLERFGFEWDEAVLYQSTRTEAYREALEKLRRMGRAYACTCSRGEIASAIYPGTCRAGVRRESERVAWRVMVDDETVRFSDRLFGLQEQNLAREAGDFVVLRSDGFFAYQLAVVVDDAAQGITDVVRGADLLDSTPRQIWLARQLGLPVPRYLHIPVVTNAAGEKLSKQTLAPALNDADPIPELLGALRLLGREVPPGASFHSARDLLDWAAKHAVPCPAPAGFPIGQ